MSGRRVLKYRVDWDGQEIALPVGSVPRHFNVQDRLPTVWIEVPGEWVSTTIVTKRTFRVFGTGHEIPDGSVYVGTCMDREFVWHLYEVTDVHP